jgi:hypothetical protein
MRVRFPSAVPFPSTVLQTSAHPREGNPIKDLQAEMGTWHILPVVGRVILSHQSGVRFPDVSPRRILPAVRKRAFQACNWGSIPQCATMSRVSQVEIEPGARQVVADSSNICHLTVAFASLAQRQCKSLLRMRLWVRIPQEVPWLCGLMDKALPCRGRLCGFESRQSRHTATKLYQAQVINSCTRCNEGSHDT